jgi:hypothetical protein
VSIDRGSGSESIPGERLKEGREADLSRRSRGTTQDHKINGHA